MKAGIADEPNGLGLGNLIVSGLFGSNLNQSSETVSRSIYAVGGSLETLWTPDYTLITCITTKKMIT